MPRPKRPVILESSMLAGLIPGASRRIIALCGILSLLGGAFMVRAIDGDDKVPAPADRPAAWKAVQKALDEGKPKTALQALAGV